MDALNLTYIQYARKSSEAKERQALSIQDQNSECDRYILLNQLNVAFRLEESKSAYKPNNRPEFNKMIELIESKQVNAILTWKPDRLCRNPREGGIILQLLQDGALQEIRTATGEIYTQNSDHLILQIHFGMANQYSRNLSQNVRRGLNHKCERGEYPRAAIYGYECFGERGRRNIRPHPIEAPIIQEMFTLATDNLNSLSYICDLLYDKGIRTKHGKRISKSHLHSILTNETYYGYFKRNGELFAGNYQAVVTKKLFDQVQAVLHDRTKPKHTDHTHPLQGLLKCGECGCSICLTIKTKVLKSSGQSQKYYYLRCSRKRGNCNQKPIGLDEFDDMIKTQLIKIAIDQEVWELGIKLLKAKHQDQSNKNLDQLKKLHEQIQQQREKLSKLIDMRANNELDKSEFANAKEKVIIEQARINALITDNEDTIKNWAKNVEDYLNTAYEIRETMDSSDWERKTKLVRKVGENFFLKDKKIEVTFKKPYDVLLKTAYRTNGLGNLDSNQD